MQRKIYIAIWLILFGTIAALTAANIQPTDLFTAERLTLAALWLVATYVLIRSPIEKKSIYPSFADKLVNVTTFSLPFATMVIYLLSPTATLLLKTESKNLAPFIAVIAILQLVAIVFFLHRFTEAVGSTLTAADPKDESHRLRDIEVRLQMLIEQLNLQQQLPARLFNDYSPDVRSRLSRGEFDAAIAQHQLESGLTKEQARLSIDRLQHLERLYAADYSITEHTARAATSSQLTSAIASPPS